MRQVTRWSLTRLGGVTIRLIPRPCHSLDPNYTLVAADKSHARIIWDCAWSAEGDIFATASRDKTVGVSSDSKGALEFYKLGR
jgi:WD40 repeat protein